MAETAVPQVVPRSPEDLLWLGLCAFREPRICQLLQAGKRPAAGRACELPPREGVGSPGQGPV